MKHKKFTEVYPYTYYIKDLETEQKYHGVRWANCSKNISPIHDFAIGYFTSGKMKYKFKDYPNKFVYRLVWTFDTVSEARKYESQVNTRLMKRLDWEVWNNSSAIYNLINPRQGAIVKGTDIATKISNANTGKKRTEKCKQRNSDMQKQKVESGLHYWKSDSHSINTSARMKENNPSKNGLSDEHKEKIGIAQRGVPKGPQSDEHKRNNSLSHKGQIPWNKGLKGVIKATHETKIKLSKSKLGKKRGPYKKRNNHDITI